MFKYAVIHYPSEEKAARQLNKDMAVFRCAAVVRYIESLKLDEHQLNILFDNLAKDIAKLKYV